MGSVLQILNKISIGVLGIVTDLMGNRKKFDKTTLKLKFQIFLGLFRIAKLSENLEWLVVFFFVSDSFPRPAMPGVETSFG